MGARATKVGDGHHEAFLGVPASVTSFSDLQQPIHEELIKSLKERGVSYSFFSTCWRKYSTGDGRITVPKAREFLLHVASLLEVILDDALLEQIIQSCQNTGMIFDRNQRSPCSI